jgi:protein-disulfide isomerase
MQRSRAFVLTLLGLGLAALACSERGSASDTPSPTVSPAAAAARAGDPAVAEIAGVAVGAGELDSRIGAAAFSEIRQREYELRKDALDDLIAERLFAREAEAQRIPVDELLRREVETRAATPDRAEAEQIFEQNRLRLPPGMTKEQALAELMVRMRMRDVERRRTEYRKELATRYGVRVLLEPPRTALTIPPDAPSLGARNAPVTIIEFADYQCPYCHRAQVVVEELIRRYEGKVRLVHRDFPLGNHPRAEPASIAARCAGEQGKFWDYHRGLLRGGSDFSDADLRRRAEALSLDLAAFATCQIRPGGADPIRASAAEAERLGVTATPTFFVNGRRLVGAQPLEAFVEVIEEELTRAN